MTEEKITLKQRIKNVWKKIFKGYIAEDYNDVDDTEYYSKFGIVVSNGEYVIDKKDTSAEKSVIEEAYKRACENRDFEIDKFWSRAGYFWAFIVLIFGAYFSLITSDKAKTELGDSFRFIAVCLNCMGILFSFAWYFVIVGSKHWQENWEQHIDRLENFISGPLYKTIYFKKDFYSVSGVNKFLAYIVILVWIGMLIVYLQVNNFLLWEEKNGGKIDCYVFSPILTSFVLLVLMWRVTKKSFKNSRRQFIRRELDPPPKPKTEPKPEEKEKPIEK